MCACRDGSKSALGTVKTAEELAAEQEARAAESRRAREAYAASQRQAMANANS